jgi:hypothetical protein
MAGRQPSWVRHRLIVPIRSELTLRFLGQTEIAGAIPSRPGPRYRFQIKHASAQLTDFFQAYTFDPLANLTAAQYPLVLGGEKHACYGWYMN